MHIEKSEQGELLVLTLDGVLDNDSSMHFRNEIDSCTRQGWHRILVDLGRVGYLSSAGIAALMDSKQQLDQLNGLFGIFNPVPQIAAVLKQVRLLELLLCDPKTAQGAESAGSLTMALSTSTRFAAGGGIDMEIYSLGEPQPLACRLIGNPRSLFAPEPRAALPVRFDAHSYGIGTGSLGDDSHGAPAHVGEIISIAGAVAQSPHINGGLPDYSVAAEDFTPVARLLYGIQWSGGLSTLIRFEPTQRGTNIGLSQLIRQAMRETGAATAALVILGDCGGLVGAQIRRAPSAPQAGGSDHFQVPGVRDWLSFGAERLYRNNLAFIAGVATLGHSDGASALRPFVRPLDRQQECLGHFHSIVFPYKPLKKRTLSLQSQVSELFDSGGLKDVLHLLRDDRPITGPGESELLSGACWIGTIDRVAVAEERE